VSNTLAYLGQGGMKRIMYGIIYFKWDLIVNKNKNKKFDF